MIRGTICNRIIKMRNFRGLFRSFIAVTMLVMLCTACDMDYSNVGKLTVNGETVHFRPRDGDKFSWSVTVTPGKRYEVVLMLAEAGSTSPITLQANSFAVFNDCVNPVDGPVPPHGLRVTFIGDKEGTAGVIVWWYGKSAECTIQLIEK